MRFRRNRRKHPGGVETMLIRAEKGMRLWIDSQVVNPQRILIIEMPEKEGDVHD